MADDEKTERRSLTESHQPLKKGYQPTRSKLDSEDPPQGGTGVQSASSKNSEESSNEKE